MPLVAVAALYLRPRPRLALPFLPLPLALALACLPPPLLLRLLFGFVLFCSLLVDVLTEDTGSFLYYVHIVLAIRGQAATVLLAG